MILPNPENFGFLGIILPNATASIINSLKNGIIGFGNSYKSILIFADSIIASLGLILVIKGSNLAPKALGYQLMPATNSKNRNVGFTDKLRKSGQMLGIVIVKIRQGSA